MRLAKKADATRAGESAVRQRIFSRRTSVRDRSPKSPSVVFSNASCLPMSARAKQYLAILDARGHRGRGDQADRALHLAWTEAPRRHGYEGDHASKSSG